MRDKLLSCHRIDRPIRDELSSCHPIDREGRPGDRSGAQSAHPQAEWRPLPAGDSEDVFSALSALSDASLSIGGASPSILSADVFVVSMICLWGCGGKCRVAAIVSFVALVWSWDYWSSKVWAEKVWLSFMCRLRWYKRTSWVDNEVNMVYY